jgi:hypothetical protein
MRDIRDRSFLVRCVRMGNAGGGVTRLTAAPQCSRAIAWAPKGGKTISCTFDDMETDEAELVEIDENLVRADLSPAERALQIGRRQELYEKKHGKAKALGGHAAQAAQGHKANANLADAFTKDATKKTRQSERSVQRDATRAKKVAVLPDIAGTSLDKGAEIDALAKLPVDKQRSLAEAAKRGRPWGGQDRRPCPGGCAYRCCTLSSFRAQGRRPHAHDRRLIATASAATSVCAGIGFQPGSVSARRRHLGSR